MDNPFDLAVAFVLQAEGAESNDPDDPGAFTRYGISQRSHPDIDVPHLTEQAAIDLYRARYWDRARLERLPPAVAVAVFDGTVQHGIRPAVRMLQDTVGTAMDGVIGPLTIAASWRMDTREALIGYCARRACYYGRLATFWKYALGWNQRIFRLFAYSESLGVVPVAGGRPGGGPGAVVPRV